MPNLFKRTGGWSWVPDADAVGAPDGALLRADNTIPDAAGARVLRRGSANLHTGLGTNVRSVGSAFLQDVKYRFAGVDDSVYGGIAAGEMAQLGANITGFGDISIIDDAYQAFFARGSTNKKYDGENYYNWGILAPNVKPIVTAVDAITVTVASFNGPSHVTPDSPAFTVNEGAGSYVDGYYSSRTEINTGTTPALTSITRSGSTATVTYSAAHGLTTGDYVIVADVTETEYNGTYQITVTAPTTYTYTVAGTPGTPATITSATITHATAYYGALELTPSETPGPGSVASATKIFASDQDFQDIAGSTGSETDLFDMRVAMDNPKKVEKVRVMFGLNTGSDPFADDYYYFDFNVKEQEGVDLKDPEVNSVAAYNAATDRLLSSFSASDITDVRSPEAAGAVVKRLTSLRGDRSQSRTDSVGASPAWGHFTVTRGQFRRAGRTSGRDWTTVRGFKVVYNVISGNTTTKMRFDDATFIGGGSRSLSGTFTVGYRYARRFLDKDGNLVYTELSPMSPISDKINLAQQSLSVNIPETALTSKDAQVDTIWVYLYGGWLDTYYRVAVIASTASTGLTIDELSNPDGSDFDDPTERTRLTTHGFTFVQSGGLIKGAATTPTISSITNGGSGTTATVTTSGAHGWVTNDYVQVEGVAEAAYNGFFQITVTGASTFTYEMASDPGGAGTVVANTTIFYMNALVGTPTASGDNSINLSLYKSELDALIENEPFEPGSVAPPSNIIGLAGPWRKRIFALTKEGWLYVSSAKNPATFSVYHAVDLRQYGTPYWVIEAGEHIYVGCSKDVIRIAGSGEIDETGVLLDLYPQELGAANPPADESAATDGNAILFRSGDGPMMLAGATLQPIPFAGTSFLWKGRSRHGVSALDTAGGRYRFEIDNHNLYMLAPEGSEYLANVWYFSQSGYTVTLTFEADHSILTGDEIVVAGASDNKYNGRFYATKVSNTAISYAITTLQDVAAPDSPEAGAVSGYVRAITQPSRVWKYMPSHQQWCRFNYGHNVLSIWREPNGMLVVGTADGRVREIETGLQDGASNISVDILTPVDDGGNPFGRKDAADLQVHANTGGESGTFSFYKDGNIAAATAVPVTTSRHNVYRSALTNLGVFLKLQLGITGSFNEFSISAFSVSYRPRPQQFMVLDTGHVVPSSGQTLAWVSHVYLDCYSPVDLQLQIYKDGQLYDTCDIPVVANIRDEYTIVMPRGTKGRRLRFMVVTTNSAGAGDVGFEPYSISVKNALSGKVTELPFGRGDQGND